MQIGASHHSLELRPSTFMTCPPTRSVLPHSSTQHVVRSLPLASRHTASHDAPVFDADFAYRSPLVPLMFLTQCRLCMPPGGALITWHAIAKQWVQLIVGPRWTSRPCQWALAASACGTWIFLELLGNRKPFAPLHPSHQGEKALSVAATVTVYYGAVARVHW